MLLPLSSLLGFCKDIDTVFLRVKHAGYSIAIRTADKTSFFRKNTDKYGQIRAVSNTAKLIENNATYVVH